MFFYIGPEKNFLKGVWSACKEKKCIQKHKYPFNSWNFKKFQQVNFGWGKKGKKEKLGLKNPMKWHGFNSPNGNGQKLWVKTHQNLSMAQNPLKLKLMA